MSAAVPIRRDQLGLGAALPSRRSSAMSNECARRLGAIAPVSRAENGVVTRVRGSMSSRLVMSSGKDVATAMCRRQEPGSCGRNVFLVDVDRELLETALNDLNRTGLSNPRLRLKGRRRTALTDLSVSRGVYIPLREGTFSVNASLELLDTRQQWRTPRLPHVFGDRFRSRTKQ